MNLLARILVGLVAIFGIVIGIGFLFDPVRLGTDFFLSPIGVPGLAVLRADMAAFFLTSGILAAVGAWRQDPAMLIAPILLYAIAITGRAVSLAIDGGSGDSFVPMAVEAFFVGSLLFARRTFAGNASDG